MAGLSRALAGLAVGGFLAGLAALGMNLTSEHTANRGVYPVLVLVIGWGFIGTGLFAWWRRPDNRIGALMTTVGFAWFLGTLSDSNAALVHTVGLLARSLWAGFAIHMLLAFPSGRLETPAVRAVVTAGYFMATVVHVLPLLFGQSDRPCPDCPPNLAVIEPTEGLADALFGLQRLVIVGLALAVCAVVAHRWRRAAGPQRRALTPVLWSGGVTGAFVALSAATESADLFAVSDAVDWAYLTSLACVPFAFLSGLLRSRLHRGEAVSGLIERLGDTHAPGGLREALAEALGDPSLTLAYWLPAQERYVDASGGAIELPAAGSDLTATEIEHEGRRIAAIIHDASLSEEPELVRAAGAAAALSLENERLEAELRARLEELRASRARIVEAGDAERRRIERDLHDGVQQRLVSLLLNLKLARRTVAGERAEDANGALWDEVEGELTKALAELRMLVSGILPPVLADRGLGAAVEELASRLPVPVEIEQMPAERLPERVEVAAYFVVSEALTNVVKHAEATKAAWASPSATAVRSLRSQTTAWAV